MSAAKSSPPPAAPDDFPLKPGAKSLRAYATALAQLANVGASHESAVRAAFDQLVESIASPRGWTLVREYAIARPRPQAPLKLDAALLDAYRLVHGVIEAKDDADDLTVEFRAKLKLGYPAKNTLFWQPRRALLVQDGKVVCDCAIDPSAAALIEPLRLFFAYREPAILDWERASEEFRERVAELGRGLVAVIRQALGTDQLGVAPNKKFQAAFADFATLCRTAINPGLRDEALEEMLVQHLLTARLFGSVFKNPDFVRRNVVAVEIEKVIDALASKHFNRAGFLQKLDRFYIALEAAAETLTDFSEKQKFLNTVYERFFQGFAVKVADTMGIVYTPPALVRFMLAGIRQILKRGFGQDLGSPGVHFLDPFTGTGNFLVHLIDELPTAALKKKYAGELWANEIMLLPYYIAALNLEHAYFERTGEYEPFPGLCLVDTFEVSEPRDAEFEFMAPVNTERVNAQKKAPIRVILGNPPYNAWQHDENDRNQNRKYATLDRRLRDTYVGDSAATLRNSLGDPYIKALRWASDRIGEEGVVAFVTNGGYLDGIAADGVRKHLAADFDAIFLVDLGGNVRKNPKLSGTTHNVFGIQVGVVIAFFVRKVQSKPRKRRAMIHYIAAGEDWNRTQKYAWLDKLCTRPEIKWKRLRPDARSTWLNAGESAGFQKFLSIGNKEAKAVDSLAAEAIFRTFSRGVCTNNDGLVYDFTVERLALRAKKMVKAYHAELDRWHREGRPQNLDDWLEINPAVLKWIRHTKRNLLRETEITFSPELIRPALYRPFTKRVFYAERVLSEDLYQFPAFFPISSTRPRNLAICVTDIGSEKPFMALISSLFTDLHVVGGGASAQCFPLYTYAEDGTHRRDNVTDWALAQFRAKYAKFPKLSKKDIFHYVYAVLHHPAYREKYAANLRRELPRIPFAPDFAAFAEAGEKLAVLHADYEDVKPAKLARVFTPGEKLDWRVERMKLSKDGLSLAYNAWLTLDGLPPEVAEYRLGNRSALEWVIDQYRVERAKDNPEQILSDPNRPDDEEYIVNLVGRVVAVSGQTVRLVASLPPLE